MKKNYFFNFLLACSLLLITSSLSVIANSQDFNTEYNTQNINNTLYTVSNNLTPLAMVTDLYVESEPTVQVFKQNDKTLEISEDDIDFMAQVVFAESKGEPFEGKVAVASVILNRVIDPNFPNTIQGVITQKNAFSCVRNGKVINGYPNNDSYRAVIEAIKGNDPTNKALYFYNPDIATCNWMHGVQKKNIQNIGHHVFFEI